VYRIKTVFANITMNMECYEVETSEPLKASAQQIDTESGIACRNKKRRPQTVRLPKVKIQQARLINASFSANHTILSARKLDVRLAARLDVGVVPPNTHHKRDHHRQEVV
jgi:hypothetical protein